MKLVTVKYVGFTAMDRRFTSAMLPWVVSEIRKQDSHGQVSLGAEDGVLQAYNPDFELKFSHKIEDISRFSQADTDPCAFLYLVHDDLQRLLYCYMFEAATPCDVIDLHQQMRDQGVSAASSVASLCSDISPNSSHFFEVLYVGKIKVSHRRVPDTFVDEALERFRTHENARRASHDFTASSETVGVIPGICKDAASPTADSQQQPKEGPNDHNRTMVLHVGRTDLRLISPDRKQILLHKQHRDVVACVQGIKHRENFAFVCKEQQLAQAQQQQLFVGYVFECESLSVANDAVGAVSQAVSSPSTPKSGPAPVTTCEHCPMVWYHRLCTDIEGLTERKTQATIFRRIDLLNDDEQSTILTKYRGAETDSVRDQNEFLMMLLRAHCEMKQNRHVHDTAENRSEFLSHYLGGSGGGTGGGGTPGTIFMKAKRSLSSSFEHLLKRKGSKDDFGLQITRDLSLPIAVNSVAKESVSDSSNSSTPACDIPDSRSSSTLSIDKYATEKSPKSPMMDIFMKVGNSPRTGITPYESPRKNESSGSWRQAIFNRVVTPNKVSISQPKGRDPSERRNSAELRALWRSSIRQAILLIRMEKENARLRARQEVSAMKRIKLEYDEMCCDRTRDSMELWEMIGSGSDKQLLTRAASHGVPASRRGDVWQRFADMYNACRQPFDASLFPNYDIPYEQLLKQLTAQQHAILIDLGRTFPNHPYYKSPLGPGQLALFNLLKAYSLLDPEVGYCQGLSFVAGVLLLHMDEADAFAALRHLMFVRGLRAHYRPDMVALQVRLYQLSRLLHDRLPELYAHLDEHEVAPTLYAAPWLLTLFASQFPLGFVTRVLDVLFLEGSDVIFRVAFALLEHHADALLACDSFEQIMDYLKSRVPDVDAQLLDKIMCRAMVASSDVATRLNEYRVEYQVLMEEANSTQPQLDELQRLRAENRALLDRNAALSTQLAMALANVQRLERNRTLQQSGLNRLEMQARTLEVSVVTLGTFIDGLVEKHVDIEVPGDVRRIVSQLMVNERRRNDQRPLSSNNLIKTISNSAQLFKREHPVMTKSLSTGRINTPFFLNSESARSVSLSSGSDLERNLRNTKLTHALLTLPDKGMPLRVIDDGDTYHSISAPNIGAKVSNFFSNTHNQILRQHRPAGSPPSTPPHIIPEEKKEELDNPKSKFFTYSPPLTSPHIIPEESKEEMDNSMPQIALPLDDKSPCESGDSGVGTPVVSPLSGEGKDTGPVHPLSGCDVNFTFNGTTKLKTIKSIRNLSRNSSPDLLGK